MTPRERVLATLNRQPVDRPPVDLWHTETVGAELRAHFGVATDIDVWRALRLDKIVWCSPNYIPQGAAAEYRASTNAPGMLRSPWGTPMKPQQAGGETYHELAGAPLADYETVEQLDEYPYWPDPGDYDYAGMAAALRRTADEYATLGPWVSLFEVYCQMRGLQTALMDLAQRPAYVQAVLDRLEYTQAELMRRCFKAAGDDIQLVFVSDDMGTQDGLLISPRMWDRFFKDRMKRWCDLIHEHGKLVFYHSDGAVAPLLLRLIEAGIDVLNPIQHVCPGMACEELKEKFGDRLIFHGAIDNQTILPFGTADDVRAETRNCLSTLGAGGGYIVCSCHNVQAGTSLENILAMVAATQTD